MGFHRIESCPLCAAPVVDAVVIVAGRDGVDVVRCPRCLFAYATAVGEGGARVGAEETGAGTAPRELRPGVERARARLGLYDRLARGRLGRPHPGSRALVIGCAAGVALDALRDLGYATEGTERGPSAARARSAGHRVHEIDAAGGDDLGERYDVILVGHVLEDSPSPLGVLAFARRHLAPGGLVVVEVGNFDDPARLLWRGDFRPLRLGERASFFDRQSLERALELAGLRRVELWSAPEVSSAVMPSALSAVGKARAAFHGLRGAAPPERVVVRRLARRLERLAVPVLGALDRLSPVIEEAVGPECPWGANLVAIAGASPG